MTVSCWPALLMPCAPPCAGEARQAVENKIQAVRTSLYGLTGEAKLPAVLSVIDDHLEKGIKMLVFAHHKKVRAPR